MTLYHCSLCEDSIDTEENDVHFDENNEPLCEGCHDFLKEEGHLEEADEELPGDPYEERKLNEDQRLDDPRHKPGNYR